MIVKVKTYKRMGAARGLLQYVLNDRKRLFDRKGKSFVLTQNLKGQDIDEWVREFKKNETYRKHQRKNNVYVTQEILSFHREDSKRISLKKLEDITKKYMELRRPGKSVYVAVPHFDKHHWHIHIIASAVEYRTGRAMRMSRGEFSELKKGIQAYQISKHPELSKSVVRHGSKRKAKIMDREYQYKKRTGRMTKREEVIRLVKTCSLNASSQEEFYARLKACKLQTYERGGKVTGVVYNRKKYRFKRLGVSINIRSRTLERNKFRLINRYLGK